MQTDFDTIYAPNSAIQGSIIPINPIMFLILFSHTCELAIAINLVLM